MSLPEGWRLSAKNDFILLAFNGEVKKAFNRKDKTVEEVVSEIDKFMLERKED